MPTETKYEHLYKQRHTSITRVVEPITPAVIDKLRDELATIAATTKTYSYPQGQVLEEKPAHVPINITVNDTSSFDLSALFERVQVGRRHPAGVFKSDVKRLQLGREPAFLPTY